MIMMMAKILVQNDDDPKKWFKRIFTLRVPRGGGSLVLWEDGSVSAFLGPSSFPISLETFFVLQKGSVAKNEIKHMTITNLDDFEWTCSSLPPPFARSVNLQNPPI